MADASSEKQDTGFLHRSASDLLCKHFLNGTFGVYK